MAFRDLNKLVSLLTDDLLSPSFRALKQKHNRGGRKTHPAYGHCYILSEAAFHLLGGKKAGWTPQHIRHLDMSHWYLKHKDGTILDLSVDQFPTKPNYQNGRGNGFLTKKPSKRAKILITKFKNKR